MQSYTVYNLDETLQRFWKIEEVENFTNTSIHDKYEEQQFVNNIKRIANGRFIVKLLVKENHQPLGESLHMAKSRFLNLERKSAKNVELGNQYKEFINEYQLLDHMMLRSDQAPANYYLPYHN